MPLGRRAQGSQTAAERYVQLAAWLKSVPIPVDGHANDIARTLVEDAERDATLLSALAEGQVPAEKGLWAC